MSDKSKLYLKTCEHLTGEGLRLQIFISFGRLKRNKINDFF